MSKKNNINIIKNEEFIFNPSEGTCYMPNLRLKNLCDSCNYKDFAKCKETRKKKIK